MYERGERIASVVSNIGGPPVWLPLKSFIEPDGRGGV
jgi:hypothetical protein